MRIPFLLLLVASSSSGKTRVSKQLIPSASKFSEPILPQNETEEEGDSATEQNSEPLPSQPLLDPSAASGRLPLNLSQFLPFGPGSGGHLAVGSRPLNLTLGDVLSLIGFGNGSRPAAGFGAAAGAPGNQVVPEIGPAGLGGGIGLLESAGSGGPSGGPNVGPVANINRPILGSLGHLSNQNSRPDQGTNAGNQAGTSPAGGGLASAGAVPNVGPVANINRPILGSLGHLSNQNSRPDPTGSAGNQEASNRPNTSSLGSGIGLLGSPGGTTTARPFANIDRPILHNFGNLLGLLPNPDTTDNAERPTTNRPRPSNLGGGLGLLGSEITRPTGRPGFGSLANIFANSSRPGLSGTLRPTSGNRPGSSIFESGLGVLGSGGAIPTGRPTISINRPTISGFGNLFGSTSRPSLSANFPGLGTSGFPIGRPQVGTSINRPVLGSGTQPGSGNRPSPGAVQGGGAALGPGLVGSGGLGLGNTAGPGQGVGAGNTAGQGGSRPGAGSGGNSGRPNPGANPGPGTFAQGGRPARPVLGGGGLAQGVGLGGLSAGLGEGVFGGGRPGSQGAGTGGLGSLGVNPALLSLFAGNGLGPTGTSVGITGGQGLGGRPTGVPTQGNGPTGIQALGGSITGNVQGPGGGSSSIQTQGVVITSGQELGGASIQGAIGTLGGSIPVPPNDLLSYLAALHRPPSSFPGSGYGPYNPYQINYPYLPNAYRPYPSVYNINHPSLYSYGKDGLKKLGSLLIVGRKKNSTIAAADDGDKARKSRQSRVAKLSSSSS